MHAAIVRTGPYAVNDEEREARFAHRPVTSDKKRDSIGSAVQCGNRHLRIRERPLRRIHARTRSAVRGLRMATAASVVVKVRTQSRARLSRYCPLHGLKLVEISLSVLEETEKSRVRGHACQGSARPRWSRPRSGVARDELRLN